MNLYETVLALFCDPEGKPCMKGSDGDRKLLKKALDDHKTAIKQECFVTSEFDEYRFQARANECMSEGYILQSSNINVNDDGMLITGVFVRNITPSADNAVQGALEALDTLEFLYNSHIEETLEEMPIDEEDTLQLMEDCRNTVIQAIQVAKPVDAISNRLTLAEKLTGELSYKDLPAIIEMIERMKKALIDIKNCESGTIARKIAIQTLED